LSSPAPQGSGSGVPVMITEEKQAAGSPFPTVEPFAKLGAIRNLLEVMVNDDEDEELTAEDRAAVQASREYFRQGGEGLSLEQVAAECGFTMDDIRGWHGS